MHFHFIIGNSDDAYLHRATATYVRNIGVMRSLPSLGHEIPFPRAKSEIVLLFHRSNWGINLCLESGIVR